MANVELSGRPKALPDQAVNTSTRINDASSHQSNERNSDNTINQRNSVYNSTMRRSPMYMSQHASANLDSIKKQDLLEPNLKSRSGIRRRCYRLKHDMIVSPMRNFIACTFAGFLFNLPIMGSIIIVYEKYTQDSLEYSRSMLPIILLVSGILLMILITLFSLGVDLLDKGCLAWHRDSIGFLLQAIIAYVCILVTAVHLMRYIEQYEIDDDIAEKSVMQCFVPLLVLSCLWLIKICCFRVKNSIMHLAISISVASMAFAFESHFDNELENAPLYIVAIPISCILLAISFQQLLEMYFEVDECLVVFNSYDSRLKRCFGIFNAMTTFCFVVSSILALYFLEQKYTNQEDDKRIVHWALFSTLIYLGVMMPLSGSLLIDLVTAQFGTEMIKQQMVTKRANYRLLRMHYEARANSAVSESLINNSSHLHSQPRLSNRARPFPVPTQASDAPLQVEPSLRSRHDSQPAANLHTLASSRPQRTSQNSPEPRQTHPQISTKGSEHLQTRQSQSNEKDLKTDQVLEPLLSPQQLDEMRQDENGQYKTYF